MAKGKYGSRIVQSGDAWTAEITRRVSARKTGVPKSEEGFKSEADAQAWIDKELPHFLEKQGEKNKVAKIEATKAKKEASEKAIKEEAYKEAYKLSTKE